ncbi:GNAT family N-acetyltransferase [Armatimonas rosea]|uniref:GNAT superfamily N-acetyltransferase n=1 Tax=Armatimonas rosea TaxID=685828 RepID=A0A7W9WA57_ARMRO|nr:GNAT family N-acetyltransferase [Armatimonas rosea]MBB6053252.1 GNAT superfamily N-acetyltransferase [Armatimonas rosea]
MSEFRVARATVDEAPLAAAILLEVSEWLVAIGQKNWEPEWFTPESMVPNAERGELWLAWDGSDPVGTMLVAATDEDFWPEDAPGAALYVHRVAVARRAAGRGVSQALLRQAEAETVAAGVPYLKLDCRADRPKLRALYEAAGFQRVDERTVFGWLHVVRYEKRQSGWSA